MFKPTQSAYPIQNPKVAAMQQFIHRLHIKTFSPVVKTPIQPYGNDKFLLNFFKDSQNLLF